MRCSYQYLPKGYSGLCNFRCGYPSDDHSYLCYRICSKAHILKPYLPPIVNFFNKRSYFKNS